MYYECIYGGLYFIQREREMFAPVLGSPQDVLSGSAFAENTHLLEELLEGLMPHCVMSIWRCTCRVMRYQAEALPKPLRARTASFRLKGRWQLGHL
jgi:hypothetical protein